MLEPLLTKEQRSELARTAPQREEAFRREAKHDLGRALEMVEDAANAADSRKGLQVFLVFLNGLLIVILCAAGFWICCLLGW